MAAQPPASLQSFDIPTSPFYTPLGKRRAASPTLQDDDTPVAPSFDHLESHGNGFTPITHRDKRRRPNLANGFQGLSITTSSPSTDTARQQPSGLSTDNASEEDEGIGLSHHVDTDDVKVEVLPDRSSPKNHHQRHHSNTHHWSIPNRAGPSSSSSSTSPTSSEENYDSDATFSHRFQRHRRYAGVAQQADEIVQPDQSTVFGQDSDLGVEDVTVPSPLGNRRRRDEDDGMVNMEPQGKKARKEDAIDIDMNGVEALRGIDSDYEVRRSKTRTIWHEPEKDRIVITSLSDTSSSRGSSRSPSPEFNTAEEMHLSQPGMKGFTLSPSLLTHLLKQQREQFGMNGSLNQNQNSLVLYRPMGIPPGEWENSIVQAWQTGQGYVDSGRFEEVNDDEYQNEAQSVDIPMDVDGDVEMS
ncbi:uncharacterized protein L201_006799 [Kwoniella dendrophila CBS 6074]|uniref:Uncharacterized protein n=1 Tax=Kwoniella dendrophila CBS 6074 TaxID=1295534 RepID=A0AAX4K2T1_9TREE